MVNVSRETIFTNLSVHAPPLPRISPRVPDIRDLTFVFEGFLSFFVFGKLRGHEKGFPQVQATLLPHVSPHVPRIPPSILFFTISFIHSNWDPRVQVLADPRPLSHSHLILQWVSEKSQLICCGLHLKSMSSFSPSVLLGFRMLGRWDAPSDSSHPKLLMDGNTA